ncbi:MAG: CxxxxCH/CxxCH domain-containing protein [Deltaproteobacteria bacterium]|nr:CxxxxCH/CxxCH domain-containing protein [Deltaproteobacteria bacterium]
MSKANSLRLVLLLAGAGLWACEGGGHANGEGDGDGGDVADGDGGADADVDDDGTADADGDVGTDGDGGEDGGPVCNTCHGDTDSPAPPLALDGSSATTSRGVGAHRSHLGSSDWHHEVACSDCHVVPMALTDPGHIDSDLPAELTWSALARNDGADPGFDGTNCSGVYCHGATLQPGGSNTSPQWTLVDGSQAECGTCHSLPPGGTHTTLDRCEYCHTEVIGAGYAFANPALHIDGTVQSNGPHPDGWSDGDVHGAAAEADLDACKSCHGDDLRGGAAGVSCYSCHGEGWTTDCTFCHGGVDNMTGAPPEGVAGQTSRDDLAVGAHTRHLSDTPTHLAWACEECHVVPADAFSPGHMDGDGRAELTFGPFNPAATYDFSAGRCSSLYCHGNGRGNNGAISWAGDPTLTCSSCHNDETVSEAAFTMSGQHWSHVGDTGLRCNQCHSTVVNSSKTIIDRTLHIDGDVTVSLAAGGTYNPATRTCTPICHDPETW